MRRLPQVLVADDDSVTRALVVATLEADGFETLEASGGNEVAALFQEHRPNVVLLDYDMPGKNGFDVCRELKTTEFGSVTPVIIMTGSDNSESRKQAYSAGACAFVAKPIAWDYLLDRTRYALYSR